MDPDNSYTRFLPLWSTRELTRYALQAAADDSLSEGLAHFVIAVFTCSLAAWGFSTLRLRTERFELITGA